MAGRFSLEREIGRGGMGIVFLARDVALDRPVAIKLLPSHFARDAAMRERFLREARTAAQFSHPNIVPIHLVEEHGDLVFFVMAFVDGETLGQRVRRAGPLTPSVANRIMREVAWALGYAHLRGVVHRDVKPDNILLERGSGRALVTDFGIARLAEAGTMTQPGELIGTVHYMSPEQAMGEPVDGRSDLYSLGVTAFFALTGKLPFDAPNVPAVLHKLVNLPAPRVALQGLPMPAKLAEAVDRCLNKDPARRFESGEALAEALADAGQTVRDVPPQVRSLLRQVRNGGVVLAGVSATFWLVLVLAKELVAGIRAFLEAIGVETAVVLIGAIGVFVLLFPVRLFQTTRRVLKDGMTHADMWNALVAEGKALKEEHALLGLSARRKRAMENRERWIGHWVVLSGVGASFIAVGVIAGTGGGVLVISALLLLSGLVLGGAGPTVDRASPLRALDLAERLMTGRFGRLLFRLAGIGLRQPERAAPAVGERTEVVLALAADGLFDELPSDVRRRFPQVPEAIGRLEAQAARLRARGVGLSDALAKVDIAAGGTQVASRRSAAEDMEVARRAARERLATVVAALESIRLDLLRLHAGVGSPDDLTADLERAREIGSTVDRELDAQRDVERLLSRTPS